MPRKPQDVTDAELAVLELLWARGAAVIREMTETLYPDSTESDYATVKKLLARLESKGFVHRDRSSKVHVFRPAIERQDLVNRRLRDVAESLCHGSLTPLLVHFAETERLTLKQQRMLQQLIDELSSVNPAKTASNPKEGQHERNPGNRDR